MWEFFQHFNPLKSKSEWAQCGPNSLFLVDTFVTEGLARGPKIPSFDCFGLLHFQKHIIFTFLRIPLEGKDLWPQGCLAVTMYREVTDRG